MNNELMQWLVEIALWTSAAIAVAVPLRWGLRRLFGARVAILAWALVPLVCLATMLPPRTVEISMPVEVATETSASTGSVSASPTARVQPSTLPAAIAAAWATGIAVLLLVFGSRQRALGRRIGRPGCRGRVCVSVNAGLGPMVVGVFRPRVILPADFRRRFNRPQQRLVLAHELTHIRRRDPFWNLVAVAFQCLLWFNPLVHWAASRFRRDQELACDEAVLARAIARRTGARREYANALLRLDHPPAFGLPAFGGHPLKERITMLTRIRSHSPNRRRLGASVAALLALGFGFAAWAADTEIRAADEAEMFSFDVAVTVDGVREEGALTMTADKVIKPLDGKPRFLARDKLMIDHESENTGWSAEIEIKRMPDERFLVDGRIVRDGEIVSAPQMIISDEPAHIEVGDPETGESAYRIDITPVDLSSPVADGAAEEQEPPMRSAQVFLTLNDNSVGKRVEWPGEPGASMEVGFDYTGEPEPWNAQVGVERLDEKQVKMCLDKLELALEEGAFSASAGCMIIDITAGKNGYMVGKLGEIGASFRMDMVPNVHDEFGAK